MSEEKRKWQMVMIAQSANIRGGHILGQEETAMIGQVLRDLATSRRISCNYSRGRPIRKSVRIPSLLVNKFSA